MLVILEIKIKKKVLVVNITHSKKKIYLEEKRKERECMLSWKQTLFIINDDHACMIRSHAWDQNDSDWLIFKIAKTKQMHKVKFEAKYKFCTLYEIQSELFF